MKMRKTGMNFVAMAAIAALIVGVAVVPAVGSVKGANPNIACGPQQQCTGTTTTTSKSPPPTTTTIKSPPPTTTTTAANVPSESTILNEVQAYVVDMNQEITDLQANVPVLTEQASAAKQTMTSLASEVSLLKSASNYTAAEINSDAVVTADEAQEVSYSDTADSYWSLIQYQWQLEGTYNSDIYNLVYANQNSLHGYGPTDLAELANSGAYDLGVAQGYYSTATTYFHNPVGGSGGSVACFGITLLGIATAGIFTFLDWVIGAAGVACSL
jgi:hypothetical protein